MDFLRNRFLPLNPIEARKFHCPSTALNLDREIAGVFWFYFCCRTIAQLFPGGLHIEVHVYIETENVTDEPNPRGEEEEEDMDSDEGEDEVIGAFGVDCAVEDVD